MLTCVAGILSWNINVATENLTLDNFQIIHGSYLSLHNASQRMNRTEYI